MKTVPVFEAKNRLSEIIAQVEHGEEFTITRRGEPVARIVAAKPAVGAAELAGVELGAVVVQPDDRAVLARCANEIMIGKRAAGRRAVPVAGRLLAEVRDGGG